MGGMVCSSATQAKSLLIGGVEWLCGFAHIQTDLMSEAELVAAEADLRGINAGALIVRTCRSQVDLAAVLDRGLYRLRSDSAAAPGQAAVSLLQVRPCVLSHRARPGWDGFKTDAQRVVTSKSPVLFPPPLHHNIYRWASQSSHPLQGQ
jgi:G3E family GTPase